MKITLQQAIFLLSNLTTKKTKALARLTNGYVLPLSVSGKSVIDKNKQEEVEKLVNEIKTLQIDTIHLKTKLTQANITTIIDKKSLGELLEEVRLKREFMTTLETLLASSSTVVEQGVGVVEYGVVNKNIIQKEYDELEKEVTTLSQKIDEINAKTVIEVTLINQ